MEVEDFYDAISHDYTSLLNRTVPWYQEMLEMMFAYFPDDFTPSKILELGCGSGNLTALLRLRFPDAEITAVDFSAEIIEVCKARIGKTDSIQYVQKDFKAIDFPKESFDLVMSSISIHHLHNEQKQKLFDKLYLYLKPKSVLIYADQCRGATDDIYAKNMLAWKKGAFKLGSTQADWNIWMKHQEEHDFHASVENQLQWLSNSGFINLDILWRKFLWSVFYAEK